MHSSGLVDGFRKALEAPVDVLVAQWIAHQTSDLGVGGSSPPWDCFLFSDFAVFRLLVPRIPQELQLWPSG